MKRMSAAAMTAAILVTAVTSGPTFARTSRGLQGAYVAGGSGYRHSANRYMNTTRYGPYGGMMARSRYNRLYGAYGAAGPAFSPNTLRAMARANRPIGTSYSLFRGDPGPGNGPEWQGTPGGVRSIWRYGRYQGNDPDPRIRQQLIRDPQVPTSGGGSTGAGSGSAGNSGGGGGTSGGDH
jgi:hypothetical protein